MARKVIEMEYTGATYDAEYGVYEVSTYPQSDARKGKVRRSFLGRYQTLAEAKANYPDAEWNSHPRTSL